MFSFVYRLNMQREREKCRDAKHLRKPSLLAAFASRSKKQPWSGLKARFGRRGSGSLC